MGTLHQKIKKLLILVSASKCYVTQETSLFMSLYPSTLARLCLLLILLANKTTHKIGLSTIAQERRHIFRKLP